MSGVSQEGIPQEEEDELFKSIRQYNLVATQEYIYDRLPMTFIDGYSLVKIALTNRFVNCTQYLSRSGLTFEGCISYRNSELRDVRGIYYPLDAPIYNSYSRQKLSRNLDEMKQIILNQVQSLTSHIKTNRKLLISYSNYGISIYDRFVKGRIIKFPISVEQGHLFVSWVPKIPIALPYEKVTQLELYNHKIEFKTDIMKFNITTLGGQADLVYNYHDTHVIGIAKSPDHEHREIELTHGSFYLFSHKRPIERRNID